MPTRPSFCGSWMLVMPTVIEERTKSTMIILIRLRNIVPMGLRYSAWGPRMTPAMTPKTIAINIFTQSFIFSLRLLA